LKQTSVNILKYILKRLAILTIRRFEPEVIAITGSVGKTSAKEAIFAVLKDHFRIRAASESFNNELGVPLAILGNWKAIGRPLIFFWLKVVLISFLRLILLPKRFYPKMLILEYGAQKPGDIKYLLEIGSPKIGVITAIGKIPVHVEYYEDIAAVAKEKTRLIENLTTSNFAILNFDDELAAAMAEKTRAKTMTFGFGEGANMRITNFENRSEDGRPYGISFKLEYEGSFVPVVLVGVFGEAHAYAGAIAALIGIIYGLNLVESAEYFSAHYRPAKRRMNLTAGVKETYIIDDSYNASPLSMEKALKVLKDLKGGRKIAVLGDMLELGRYSIEAHEGIGKIVAETADILVAIGPRGKFISEGAKNKGMHGSKILNFDTAEEAAKTVEQIIRKGDVILVKASRAMELDKVVEEIKSV